MQTYARHDVALARGEGARFYDTDGKEYIDFSSGIGVNSLTESSERTSTPISANMSGALLLMSESVW
jgi:acetylornithine/N-succinyldiaminopimelate aminotransferase